jgi:hypothetical protein
MLEPLKDWVKKRYTETETVLTNKKTKLKQSHFSFPIRKFESHFRRVYEWIIKAELKIP